MNASVRLFVGCAPNGDDAESMAVLEHSVRSRSSVPVDITWMMLSRNPASPFYSDGPRGWQTRQWATPFSGFRWLVPALCGYQGRAVYTDSDVMFRRDIAELNGTDMHGRTVVAKGGEDSWRFCVSLWDCAKAKLHIPTPQEMRSNPSAHSNLQRQFRQERRLVQAFGEVDWNVIDGENYSDLGDPRIGALHYSSESHQPHLALAVPRMRAAGREHWFVAGGGVPHTHWNAALQVLFGAELDAAIAAGCDPAKYVPEVPYGDIVMASRANYRPNKWAPVNARS